MDSRLSAKASKAPRRAAIRADARYASPVMMAVITAARARPSSESYGKPSVINSAPKFV